MPHHDIFESDQSAAALQSRLRQLDRERSQDFDAGAGLGERFATLLDLALGNAAFARAAVLGPLLLCSQQYRGLTAAAAVGAAGLVAVGLSFLRLLYAALGIA